METLPSDAEALSSPARSAASQNGPKVQSRAISVSLTLTDLSEVTDIDVELIEMRYKQMVALMNLEDLFAEGALDRI